MYPGGRFESFHSGGTFDFRGRKCVDALYSIVQFASGKLANGAGKKISDYVSYKVLTDNIGLYGSSNGGNIAGLLFAFYSSGLENVKYIVFYESPVGDQYILADLGGVRHDPNPKVDADRDGVPWDDGRNPCYVECSCSESGCKIDYSTLSYDPTVGFYLDNNGNGKPDFKGVYPHYNTDVDNSGAVESDEDFIFTPWEIVWNGEKRWVYSYDLMKAASEKGLLKEVSPKVLSLEETLSFWVERDLSYHYDEVSKNAPWLKIMQLGCFRDHVQATRDHPHVVVNYNAFKSRGHWVRLNPDSSYLKLVLRVEKRENKANIELNCGNIVGHLLDLPQSKQAREALMLASMLEMADRVFYNNWSEDLASPLVKE